MSAQHTIDALEFALQGRSANGALMVSNMPRLRDALYSTEGVLTYRLSGEVSGQGKPRLHLDITGELVLNCQRCLGALEFPIGLSSTLELVVGDSGFIAVEDELADVDQVPAGSVGDIAILVEDEVLLNLPVAPVHLGKCGNGVESNFSDMPRESPFGVLSSLKKNR